MPWASATQGAEGATEESESESESGAVLPLRRADSRVAHTLVPSTEHRETRTVGTEQGTTAPYPTACTPLLDSPPLRLLPELALISSLLAAPRPARTRSARHRTAAMSAGVAYTGPSAQTAMVLCAGEPLPLSRLI